MATRDFVDRDHELEQAHTETLKKLAEHRWHWILDESNPDRLSPTEHARDTGRSAARVHAMAHGYAAWQKAITDPEFVRAAGEPTLLASLIEARMRTAGVDLSGDVQDVPDDAHEEDLTRLREELRARVDPASPA